DVPAVNVVLIRGVDDLASTGRERHVLDLESAGGEQIRRTSGRRHRVEMQPAVALPGEDDAVARGPKELILRDDLVEDAAAAFPGAPNFAALTRGYLRDVNGPRLTLAPGPERKGQRGGGDADKRDTRAVGRPNRI